jgi:hypothetical protein
MRFGEETETGVAVAGRHIDPDLSEEKGAIPESLAGDAIGDRAKQGGFQRILGE